MNCQQAKSLLPTLDQGGMRPRRSAALMEHLTDCSACRGLRTEHEDTLRLLSAYEMPPLPAGFGAQLRARLEAEAMGPSRGDTHPLPALEEEPRRRRTLRALAYLAAGLLVGALTSWGIQSAGRAEKRGGVPNKGAPAQTSLRLGQVAVVTLAIEAGAHHPDAELEVVLPDGLALVGEGLVDLDEKVLKWSEVLRPGTNLIRVPVRALRPGRWLLVARARAAGHELGAETQLKVTDS